MNMQSIFQIDTYREILKLSLQTKKSILGCKFTFEKMAHAAKIQRTYLSYALSGRGHLNSDQVFMCCCFLNFSEDERYYTILLNEYERSESKERKLLLKDKIKVLKNKNLRTTKFIKAQEVVCSEKGLEDYYRNFYARLIHMHLSASLPPYNLNYVRKKMGISQGEFQKALAILESAQIITMSSNNNLVVNNNATHLSKDAIDYGAYRTQMLNQAITQMSKLDANDYYSFSVLFSSNESTRAKIKSWILDLIKRIQDEVGNNPKEDVYQIDINLLKWS